MNANELINSEFAKTNIKIYFRYRVICAAIFIVLGIMWNAIMIWGIQLPSETSTDTLKLIIMWVIGDTVFLMYILYASMFLIRIKSDIYKKDVAFEKIIIEDILEEDGITKDSILAPTNMFPEKKLVHQWKIIYYNHYGNKRKLHMVMSTKKVLKLDADFCSNIPKELPVYYLRTSGVILAIMDEDAPSQERLWYKMLNCEI